MEASVCSQDGNITLNFLLPAGQTVETCSPGLVCAFQACQENGLNPEWMMTEDCVTLSPTKQDVFVCDPFEGEGFNHLIKGNFKCVVIGPRCLLTCLHRKEPIPELPSPIHNTAMRSLVITTTGYEKVQKAELQKLVERMAGIYSNNFHEGVTHLVANSVGSKKYIVAVEKEIPVMTGEWVSAVWKAVNKDFRENFLATDQQFLSYACPVFKGLVICVSQMPRKEKEAMKKMIQENGGTYSPTLEMAVTSVLIIPTPEGEKYTHACNWRLHCLTPDWIYDSVEQGHALEMDGYRVTKRRGASTPTNDTSTNLPPDLSMCSTIVNESMIPKVSHVNETVQSDVSMALRRNSMVNDRGTRGAEAIENVDLQQAMKAGLFLDGCKVFVSGFEGTHMEKLRRLLNAGGATRFNQLTESVTHMIAGKYVDEHFKTMESWSSKPHIVYGDWIAESVKQKHPAEEYPFSYVDGNEVTAALTPPKTMKPIRKSSVGRHSDNNETFIDEGLINQYLKPQNIDETKNISTDSANMSSLPDSQSSFAPGIYKGKVFTVSGYNEESTQELITTIQDHGGMVVQLEHNGRVHYSLINIDGTGTIHPRAEEVISHTYIEDCLEQEGLIGVEYYHVPLQMPKDMSPLSECTIGISTYMGKERLFLINIASSLGARFQEVFAKKDNPAKKIKKSTHLICPNGEGDKYHAAIKWGVPAVTREWLLECVKTGDREPEDCFTVGSQNQQEQNGKAIIIGLLRQRPDFAENMCRVEETIAADMTAEIAATPLNNKVRALREQSNKVTPSSIKTPDLETMRRMYPTPGVSRGNDSLDEMTTPDTPYGCTWFPDPSSRIRKGFKRLIDSIPDDPVPKKLALDPGTPMEVYYKRFFDNLKETVENHKPKVPTWSNKDEEKVKSNPQVAAAESAADKHGPLTGVVVCTARKLQDQQRELYQTVAELGGDYRWTFDHSVTHFIFLGRGNDTNKEFRLARDQGKVIVAPEWVWMCRDEGTKIDENLFPHTHNPKMSLSIISAKTTPVTRRGRPRKKFDDETSPSSKSNEDDVESRQNEEEDMDESHNEEEKNIALTKQLEEIEALANVSGSGRRNASAMRSRSSVGERLRHTPTRSVPVETQPATIDVPESQNTAITWDDPQEREARLHIQNQLSKDTQEIINQNQHQSSDESEDKENTPTEPEDSSLDDRDNKATLPDRQPVKAPQLLFVLSGMNEDDKILYASAIESLGGQVSTSQNFDPECSHVVTLKPTRSEKHLGAIASGKWILYKSFLDESQKLGSFVAEEPHEWGNPSSKFLPPLGPGSLESKLAAAARRWRIALLEHSGEVGRKGAFKDMQALLHTSKERMAAFTRLIEAGGGIVLKGKPPYKDVTDATHVFVEPNKNTIKIDLAWFASRKIPCLAPVFLNEYLVKDPLPAEMDHCIPEYNEILEDMR